MSLIIFLVKVSNLELPKSRVEAFNSDDAFSDTVNEEVVLLCAKMSFRGILCLSLKQTNKYSFFFSSL
jgi:hypothetical protein